MGRVIDIKGLTKLYKNGRGVKNISLAVEEGDILGLLGPNGSGKTTIMKLILGLLKPNSGDIKVFNMSLEDNFEKVMANTGSLIEAPAIYKHMTAYQNLMLTANMHRAGKDKINEALDFVRLTPYKNEQAGKFSLGMKQRLGLAQALIAQPKLVILDEPVNGLDIEGVVEIREMIQSMNIKHNTTFVISSHIASEIEKVCSKVCVIYDGEISDFDTIENALRLNPSLEEYFLDSIKSKRGVL